LNNKLKWKPPEDNTLAFCSDKQYPKTNDQ